MLAYWFQKQLHWLCIFMCWSKGCHLHNITQLELPSSPGPGPGPGEWRRRILASSARNSGRSGFPEVNFPGSSSHWRTDLSSFWFWPGDLRYDLSDSGSFIRLKIEQLQAADCDLRVSTRVSTSPIVLPVIHNSINIAHTNSHHENCPSREGKQRIHLPPVL